MPLYRIELREQLTGPELVERVRHLPGFSQQRSGALWIAREVKFRRALKHDERALKVREQLASVSVEVSFYFPESDEGWLMLFVPGHPIEIACDEDAEIEGRLRELAATLRGKLIVEGD